ncbi:tumor protein D53 isoform X6 [Mycteria americana]
MEPQAQGLLETQSLHEADEDVVTDVDFTNMISEEEKEELKIELAKGLKRQMETRKKKMDFLQPTQNDIPLSRELVSRVSGHPSCLLIPVGAESSQWLMLEDEISTLRQVLAAKEKHLVEIKQKLGISLMNELKQNFSKSWHDMQTTSAYKKTHETLSHAGQKATAAISNVGTAISKKFGDMRSHSIG